MLRAEIRVPEALRDRALDLRIVRLPARVRVEGDGEPLDDIAPPLLDGYRVETPRAFSETSIERVHALVGDREESSAPTSDEGPPLTETGLLPGTPLYIAPELARGPDALRPASDLFAFGVLAYELLIGRKPYDQPVALAVLEERRPPPRLPLAPHWPSGDPAIVTILEACLALDPAERPSARDVADALEIA